MPEETSAAVQELGKVMDVIKDPGQRQSFAANPDQTLQQRNVNTGAIPGQVVDVLKGLSPDELGLLARFHSTLIDSGLSSDVPDSGQFGF